MRLRRPAVAACLTLTLLLSALGCDGDSDGSADSLALLPTPTQTPMPTVAPPIPTPTPTHTPTPAPALTPTPIIEPPTSTPTPTLTPTPTQELPTPTLIPTPTSTPIPSSAFLSLHDLSTACYPRDFVYEYLHSAHQWSPDGSRVLFNVGPDIYTVDAGGSEIEKIVDTSGEIRFDNAVLEAFGTMATFDISPDGSKLAYSTCRYGTPAEVEYQFAEGRTDFVYTGNGFYIPYSVAEIRRHAFDIAVSNIDGTETKKLTENEASDNFPVWSPLGGRIAFISSRGDVHVRGGRLYGRLYRMLADGSDVRLLYDGSASNPVWNPDGRRIAFVAGGAVHTVRSNGSELTKISAALSGPAWSPDGRRLALVAPDGDGAALYTFALDGSDPVRVARLMDDASQEVEPGLHSDEHYEDYWVYRMSDERFRVSSVSWSPLGSEILVGPYLVDLESPGILSQIDLGTYADDPFEKAWLGRQDHAWYLHHVRTAWSPDGSAIAATVAGGQPYIIDLSEANLRVLPAVSRGAHGVAARIASCSGGYVVADPESFPGLVRDCETLMGIRDSLTGDTFLNWRQTTPIEYWYGVEVSGSPSRVTTLLLEGFLRIPPGMTRSELNGRADARALGPTNLTGNIPVELGNLSNLEVLVLTYHQLIGSIPAALGNLTNLEELDLSNNKLTGSIPAELGELPKLRIVKLTSNELEGCITLANGRRTCG